MVREIALCFILAAAFCCGWAVKGWKSQAAIAQLEQKHADAHAAALSQYQQMESVKDDAIKKYEERAADDARNAAAAIAAANSLRSDLAKVPNRISTATRQAVDEYAATASIVLAECSAEYQQLASKAQGHANDARLMSDAWPQ